MGISFILSNFKRYRVNKNTRTRTGVGTQILTLIGKIARVCVCVWCLKKLMLFIFNGYFHACITCADDQNIRYLY